MMFSSSRLVSRLSKFNNRFLHHGRVLRTSNSADVHPWKEPTVDLVGDLPHTPVMLDETLFYLDVKPGIGQAS